MTGTTQNQNPLSYMGVRAKNPGNITLATADPTPTTVGTIGDQVINTANASVWELASAVGNAYTWVGLGGGDAAIDTINNNAPIGGNYTLAGTANQISKAETAGTTTFSLPNAITAPGSLTTTTTLASGTTFTAGTGITATTGNIVATAGNITTTAGSITSATTLTATAGAITATNGNLVLGTAGNKLSIATGANASMGTTVAMTAGTITVSTTAAKTGSTIFVSANTLAGTPGTLSAPVASIVNNTSFVITSSSNTDTSTVNWLIVN